MIDVEAHGDQRNQVENDYQRVAESRHQVVVDVPLDEIGMGRAPGEVTEVIDKEDQDQDLGLAGSVDP